MKKILTATVMLMLMLCTICSTVAVSAAEKAEKDPAIFVYTDKWIGTTPPTMTHKSSGNLKPFSELLSSCSASDPAQC